MLLLDGRCSVFGVQYDWEGRIFRSLSFFFFLCSYSILFYLVALDLVLSYSGSIWYGLCCALSILFLFLCAWVRGLSQRGILVRDVSRRNVWR